MVIFKNITSADDLTMIIRSLTMCGLAIVLCISLCATLFFKSYADPTVLVTIVGAMNLLLGYLAGKRPQQSSQTDLTATTDNGKIETKQTTEKPIQ